MQSRQKLTEKQLRKWSEGLIGETWEIYWEPESANDEKNIPSSSSSLTSSSSSDGGTTPIVETDEDDNSAYDADWYDGFIKSYSPRDRLFEVVFVGDDTVYKMNLKPQIVRPLERSKKVTAETAKGGGGGEHTLDHISISAQIQSQALLIGQSCLKWKQHLVGKEWEIYWDVNKTAVFVEDQQNIEFDADWYDGKVQSYSTATNTFQVAFTGEDCVYQMQLGPEVVRPSANAWIRRTRYLLSASSNAHHVEWSCQLPPAPATYDTMNLIQDQIASRIEESDHHISYGDARGNDLLGRGNSVLELSKRIEEQIILYSHLTIDSHDFIDDTASPKIRTEQYIKYLLQCLDVNKKACAWYHDTTSTLAQTSADDESIETRTNDEPGLQGEVVSAPLEVNDVYNKILLGFHLYMRLMTMDIDANADTMKTTKKRHSPPPIQNGTSIRSKKRRRRNSSVRYNDFRIGSSSSQSALGLGDIVDAYLPFDATSNRSFWDLVIRWLDENVDDEITYFHPCVDIFDRLQQNLNRHANGSRFLVLQISHSIHAILSSMWDRVLHWLLTSSRILLWNHLPFEQKTLHVDDSEPKTMYKISDIQHAITLATTDSTLRRFNLSLTKSKLTEKINEIQAFECKVWSIIETCTNNDVKLPLDNEEQVKESEEEQFDHTICELRNVQNEMEDNPHIKNISPIGINNLTRKTVENAIELRFWVIHYHKIESSRERVSLISTLKTSKINEFHVQHQPTQEAISQKLDKMKLVLDQKWEDFDKRINHQLPLGALEYDCENQCVEALKSLFQYDFVTSCEEKLTILADILALKKTIQKILEATPENKVDFEVVKSTFNLLDDVKRGKSKRRNQLVAGLQRNTDCEDEMIAFTTEKLAKHLSTLEQSFVDLYNFGRTWMQSVKGVLKILKMDNAAQDKTVTTFGKVQMVEFAKVDEFIKQYKDRSISFQIYFEKLIGIQNNVVSWVDKLTMTLSSAQVFCPFQCRSELTELRSTRPKGILMHPPRHLVDAWIDVLKWYEDCNTALDGLKESVQQTTQSEEDVPLLLSNSMDFSTLILRGIELIKESPIDTFQKFLSYNNFNYEDTKKSPTNLVLEKLNNQPQGRQLLEALVSYDRELGFNGVIALCRILLWEQAATDLVRRSYTTSQVSLKDAQALLDLFDIPVSSSSDLQNNEILTHIFQNTYATLESRTKKVQQIETDAINLLNSLENLQRDRVEPDFLVNLINQMKIARDNIKTCYHGFRVDKSVEARINHKIRDTLWFVNLLKYPTLVRNIDLKHVKSRNDDASSSQKIASQDFFGLCDKMPQVQRCSTLNGFDATLAETSDKLATFKTACSEWEAKVQNKLPLSTRGLKRRRKIIPEIQGKGNDKSSHLITRNELQELISNPILDIVDLPLHSVVQRVFDSVSIIEDELKAILTADIDSDDIDRTPIPTCASLIGSQGEFSIFKLVGGKIFMEMQNSLHKVDKLCNELDDIKTTEVITIQWISSAVHWIESLSSLMAFGKNGKLELSLENAEELAISGSSILLGVEDVVRKCILRHKISLYTNDKTRNFSVKVARGGITHSLGAYVLRWIEYCFNGLRGDIYATYEFTKSVENFSSQNGSCREAIRALSEIKANLFVSPAKETNEYFHDLCKKHNSRNMIETSSVKQGGAKNAYTTRSTHRFDHNLIFG